MPRRSLLLARKVLRISARVVAALAALVLLIFLGGYVVNIFDENLTPEAKALLSSPPNPYDSSDNIYVALAGLDAATQPSFIAAGEARIAKYNRELDSMLANPGAELAAITSTDPNALTFKGNLEYCHPLTSSLWNDVKSRRAAVAGRMADNQELFRRYTALHQLHGYYDTSRPSFLEPIYYVPLPLRCLFLADLALRIQTSNQKSQLVALNDLSQDLLMWRAVLKGDGTLLSKMIASGALHADLLLLADMIADPGTDLELFDAAEQQAITPFELTDWRISGAFGAEMRANAPLFTQVATMASARTGYDGTPVPWWQRSLARLQGHFFKVNATENLQARHVAQLIGLADSDPSQFSVKREQYRQWLSKNDAIFSPAVLFNPTGKVLLEVAVPAYEGYSPRVYDVAALQRLVYLVYQIRRQAIDSSAVPAFLKQHPGWSTHPIDGRPFTWNAVTEELAVATVGNNPEGQRFSVILHP